MRQIAILPSGCQLNHKNSVLYFSSERLIYASSLAVYVLDPQTFAVQKVLSVNQRSITSISVSPHDRNLIAVGSVDGSICVWNVEEEEVLGRLTLAAGANVSWDPFSANKCALLQDNQGIKLSVWDVFAATTTISEVLHVRNDALKVSLHRWSPNLAGCVAIGCSAGATIVFKQKDNSHRVLQATDRKSNVVDLQWDRLSTGYLLIAYQFHIILWDIELGTEVNSFEKQPLGITSIMWLDWTAGNFITTNCRNHNLKVWNASQSTPIDSIKIKAEGGVTSCTLCTAKMRCLMAANDGSISVYDMKNSRVDFKSSAGHTETIFACKFSPISPHTFATGSYDGTVKIWYADTLVLQKTLVGNGDIIYCLDWSPTAKQIATSSFSGLVTIWDVETGRELARYLNHTKASFFVAWNQKDERYLASSSADNSVLVLEIDFEGLYNTISTAKSIASRRKTTESHKENVSISIIKRRYLHNCQVFGIAWNPFQKQILCSCSQDGIVRIFDTNAEQTTPILLMSGHSARVFSCAWSPIVEGMLATGSDDYNVIVWQIEKIGSVSKPSYTLKKLAGHKGFVRALSWNFENPDLLLSGSWDNSIRMWDVSTGSCLYELQEHIADVYALTSTPFRPCCYISASRDTTIRVWELQGTFTLMRYYCVWDESLNRSKALNARSKLSELATLKLNAVAPSVSSLLNGEESQRLERVLTADSRKADPKKYYHLFYFFTSSPGYLDVWENVLKLLESNGRSVSQGLLRPSQMRQVYHESEVLSMARASIKSFDSSKAVSRRMDGAGKDESVNNVAMMHCKLGDFEKYCQLLVEEGRWEAALAIAPVVSQKFWMKLISDYTAMLSAKGSEDCVPYFLCVGKHKDAVDFYLNRNDTISAMIVAKSSERQRRMLEVDESAEDRSPQVSQDSNSLVKQVGCFESEMLSMQGLPLLACAKLIAIGDVEKAISVLAENYEYDLAYAIAKVFDVDPSSFLSNWADRCATWGALDLAIDIIQKSSAKSTEIPLLISKFCEKADAEVMMRNLHIQSIENWAIIAQEEEATGSDSEAIVAYVISRDYLRASEISVSCLNRFAKDPWTISLEANKVFLTSKRIRAQAIPADMRIMFLTTMLWFSAHDAIVHGAFRTAIEMLNILLDHVSKIKFPVSEGAIQLQMCLLYILCADNYGRTLFDQLRTNTQLTPFISRMTTLNDLIRDEGNWGMWTNAVGGPTLEKSNQPSIVNSIISAVIDVSDGAKLPAWGNAKGIVKSKLSDTNFVFGLAQRRSNSSLLGSMLPVANQQLKSFPSFISGNKIQGSFFYFDGKPISINEAAGWARFFPYSPTLNGEFFSL